MKGPSKVIPTRSACFTNLIEKFRHQSFLQAETHGHEGILGRVASSQSCREHVGGAQLMPIQSQETGNNFRVKHQHAGSFQVECSAGERGSLRTTTDSLSINAGQQICRGEDVETWNSVSIYSSQETDGSLSLRIIVFHPDWEEPIQIACLRSWPQKACDRVSIFQCDLEHKQL